MKNNSISIRTGPVIWLVVVIVLSLNPCAGFVAAADSWKSEWEQMLAAGKKEGEIAFY